MIEPADDDAVTQQVAVVVAQPQAQADTQLRAQVKDAALRLLARREHSTKELTGRLTARFDPQRVEAVMQELIQQGLQSDDRYAGMMLQARVSRGQGPLRIEQELKSRGVASDVVARLVGGAEVDWFELARETLERRFGSHPATDWKSKSKQYRFLQYRGFDAEQIQYALNPEK